MTDTDDTGYVIPYPGDYAYTPAQLDAIYERQREDPEWAGTQVPALVAGWLRAHNDPLFVGAARMSHAPAPRDARNGLDFGAPQTLAPHGAVVTAQSPAAEHLLPAPHVEADPWAAGAGLEDLDQSDVRIPALKVRQGMTKDAEGVPEGHWFLASDPEGSTESRPMVLLELRKERSLLLPYSGGDAADAAITRIRQQTGVTVPDTHEGPVCFSRDRVTPVQQDGIAVLSESCKACPMSRWRVVRGKRLLDCSESYRILVYDVVSGLPAVYYARGSAIRPVRDLLTSLQVACRRHGLPAYGFRFDGSAKKARDGDEHFTPVFGALQRIEDRDEIAMYASVRAACASVRDDATDDDA